MSRQCSSQEFSLDGGTLATQVRSSPSMVEALAAQIRSSPSMVEHWQLKSGVLPQWWSIGSSNQELSLNGGGTGSSNQEFSLNGGALAAQARSSPSMVEHWQLKPGVLPQWWSTGSSSQELSSHRLPAFHFRLIQLLLD